MSSQGYAQLQQSVSQDGQVPASTALFSGRSSIPDSSDDVVQFTVAIFFVSADEGKIQADIMRIGPMLGSVAFTYSTAGASALEGRQFLPTTGRIELGPGEGSATIEVPILNEARWNPTTEFTISISDPEGCTLGLYLKTARVKVIDASVFPHNNFRAQIAAGDEGIDSINKVYLFGGFLSLMWQQDSIWWKTLVTLFLDQLSNIYVYIRLMVSIYMVDTVFNMDSHEGLIAPGNRLKTSYYVAACIFAPMVVLYVAELLKMRMDIGGHLRRDLSRSIFRKIMNYTKESREDVPPTDMVGNIGANAQSTTKAYVLVLESTRLVGKLAISIFFTLEQNPDAWWAVAVVPLLMLIWGSLRTNIFIRASTAASNCEAGLLGFSNEMLLKLSLIADYMQRPQINMMFAEKSEELREIQIPEAIVSFNNMFFPKLLGPGLVSLYTAIGAGLVLNGDIKLGVYLATISVFGDICESFSELFGKAMEITSKVPALLQITHALNKAIDVPSWKAVNRARRAETKKLREEKLKEIKTISQSIETLTAPFVPAADLLPINMHGMTFTYTGHGHDPVNVFKDVHLTCPQGVICSIIGQPGHGRKTMLELLAHRCFPTSGSIFVPSHLRILFVGSDPVLLRLSVWENLTFGNHLGNNPYRVEKILKHLEMHDVLQLCEAELASRKKEFDVGKPAVRDSHIQGDDPVAAQAASVKSLDALRATQRGCLHLARAFVMNPEVMVLQRPFVHFPKNGASHAYEHIMDALIQHKENRGFMMAPDTVSQRRPRTIFYTPDTHEEESLADYSWILPDTLGGVVQHGLPPDPEAEVRVRPVFSVEGRKKRVPAFEEEDADQKGKLDSDQGDPMRYKI